MGEGGKCFLDYIKVEGPMNKQNQDIQLDILGQLDMWDGVHV